MAGEFAAMQPPPEAVTTIVAEREEWPATLSAIGTVAAVQGVTVSADLPASSTASRSIPGGPSSRETSSCSWTRNRNRRSSRRGGAARARASELRAHEGPRRTGRRLARRVRQRGRRAQAGRSQDSGDSRHHRAKNDPRAVLRRARHPPGQPRSVPDGRRFCRPAAVAESDLRELRRSAAGRGSDASRTHGAHHG